MSQVKRLTDLIAAGQLAGKRVFIRADLNVPQDDRGNITEDTRVRASVPAIQAALDAGAAVMVTSHLGRPTEGEFKPEDSLAPVAKRLAELLGRDVPLVSNWVENGVNVAPGQVVLLENCRVNKGEKKNSDETAQKMAKLCDVYVNDAFGTAHRAEATTTGSRSTRRSRARPLLAAELDALGKALGNPARPLVAIVAGSKVSTKLTILKSLAGKVDQLIVGGGIANTFMLAAGLSIGKSLAEADLVNEAKAIIDEARERGASVPIPTDVVTAKEFSPTAAATVKQVADIEADDMILDIGPDTAKALASQLEKAGTIVWNGPVGVFEFDQFGNGTKTLAEAIAKSSAFSIAGGGDTLAAIAKYGIHDQVSYISTGGGAFLEFLEGRSCRRWKCWKRGRPERGARRGDEGRALRESGADGRRGQAQTRAARANTAPRAPAAAGDAAEQHHEIQNKAMPGASTGTPRSGGRWACRFRLSQRFTQRIHLDPDEEFHAARHQDSRHDRPGFQFAGDSAADDAGGPRRRAAQFSHGTADDHRQRAEMVREAARKVGREIAIMADLQAEDPRRQVRERQDDARAGPFILDAGCELGNDERVGPTTRSCRVTCARATCCC